MKKFVITGLFADNVANLDSVTFTTNGGDDVLVTGQNGAGKTTVKNALKWALVGTTADGEKLLSQNRVQSFRKRLQSAFPNVEVEIFDGSTYTHLRRELLVAFKTQAVTTHCYICGDPVTQKDITQYFTRYVSEEVLNILIEPESFFKLKAEEQRKILTRYFGNISENEVIAADESLKEPDTKGLTLEKYAESMKAKIRRIKSDRIAIPKQIEELTNQAAEVADDRSSVEIEIVALETRLYEATAHFQALQESLKELSKPQEQLNQVNNELYQLRSEYREVENKIAGLNRELESLREKWEMVSNKTCPTCGQAVQSEKVSEMLNLIEAQARGLKSQIESETVKLEKIKVRGLELKAGRNELYEKVKGKGVNYDELNEVVKVRDEIQSQINERKNHIAKLTAQLERNEKNQRRIDELIAQEKTLGKELVECEHQLALVEKFTRKKMEMITDAINGNFEHVKFKMFETLKNGEVRNICEATMNGVPYGNLSKGEKLKAALDVVKTFQNASGVMFPLIIDDAESYTSNSLIEVPNQKILFKAVEGQSLKIEVEPKIMERRLSA